MGTLVFVLVALVISVAFLALLFIVELVERRLTRPYVMAGPDELELNSYAREMAEEIGTAGYTPAGNFVHAKHPNVHGTIWSSPGRECIVLAGSGKLAGMVSRQTYIFSRLNDGRVMITKDSNDEGDGSGTFITKRVLNVHFPELVKEHYKRLNESASQIQLFDGGNTLDALLGIYDYRTQRMVEMGLAKFIDASGESWRHTAKGATHIVRNFFKQMAQAMPQRAQMNQPKVGAGYQPPRG